MFLARLYILLCETLVKKKKENEASRTYISFLLKVFEFYNECWAYVSFLKNVEEFWVCTNFEYLHKETGLKIC